jgi:hypothetical protein
MVIALAGRRIDRPAQEQRRFPLENVGAVGQAVRQALLKNRAIVLVSSAACGADLLALREAGELGIRRRVILPYPQDRFRDTSVTDRPGDWGGLYDKVIHEVSSAGDLSILAVDSPDEAAYAAVNRAILDDAQTLGRELRQETAAVVVWEGQRRGGEADAGCAA